MVNTVIRTHMLKIIRTRMDTLMNTDVALTRLFQLISPSLPIGGYSYSQGIEWAVEKGWIKTADDLSDWLQGLMQSTMPQQDLPLLLRMYDAWQGDDLVSLERWNEYLLASRESAELRLEESNRARAFAQILISLDESARSVRSQLMQSQHACFSYACARWQVSREQACFGLLWSWLENLVLAAVKIIPLGQTAGQRVIFQLSEAFPTVIAQAQQIEDDHIGASSMALAIASSRHETQYTRLYRS